MSGNSLSLLILAGVVLMLLFALGVIWFLSQAQKKITAVKLAEQEKELNFQKELLDNTVRTQENERDRIAGELHDDVTSKLNIIHLNMHLLKQRVKDDKETSVIINQIDASLTESIDRSRIISHELMPVVLKKFGLNHALDELLISVNNTGIFDLSIDQKENIQIKDDFKNLHIFRIIQELINNAIKYSKANHVNIEFTSVDNQMTLSYEDDGVGMDEKLKGDGLGFSNINTRIRLLGGEMKIKEHIANKGLSIQFNFPNYD